MERLIENHIKGKKILILSAFFFDYHRRIANRLSELGAEVQVFNDKPDDTFLLKSVIRVNKNLASGIIRRYYSNIFLKIKDCKFNYILVISPEVIDSPLMKLLIEYQPEAKRIMYMWDSFANRPNAKEMISLFHRVLTFDPVDGEEYNIPVRPLFYTKFFDEKQNDIISYDYSFIGTVHSDRYFILKKLINNDIFKNLNGYCYMYLQGRPMYYIQKLLNPSFRSADVSEFKFQPLPYNDFINISNQSNVIIDIEHPQQKGLTMRTIEVFGMRKKLITTNRNVLFYDLYNPNNIAVIDRKEVIVSKNFFQSGYVKLPNEVYYKYSIDGWIQDVFCNNL